MDTNYSAQNGEIGVDMEPKSGIGSQIIGVFTSPVKAFEEYVKKPNWWLPLMLVIIGTIVFSVLAVKYNSQLQYDIMKTSKSLPAQVLEQMRQGIDNPNYVGTVIGGVVMGLIPGLIAALLAWGVGTFIFGGQARFLSMWGVVMMGALITTLGNFLKIPLMIAKNTALVSIGPAALFPDKGPTSIFFLFLLFLDVFAIWVIIVTGIGYAKALKISNGGGITTSVIVTMILVFAFIGLQLIGMKFAGVETTWF
ncbi:MAG: YIP1 family protein [Candidatus Zixiibacteriota bacterium]